MDGLEKNDRATDFPGTQNFILLIAGGWKKVEGMHLDFVWEFGRIVLRLSGYHRAFLGMDI